MIGQAELSRLSVVGGVEELAQEKDYVLAWLLAARARLGPRTLVFKGGTALGRCYFADYRYSEDLDFTSDVPLEPPAIAGILARWCEWIGDQTGIRAGLIENRRSRNGTTFISYVGPLGHAGGRELKVDVATNEVVREGSVERLILSDYSDLDGSLYPLDVYSLVEIWAEKTRSLLQRSEPRDIYDLDHLFAGDATLPERALELFRRKARAKELDPSVLLERLGAHERTYEALWANRLATQVRDLDASTVFGAVWSERSGSPGMPIVGRVADMLRGHIPSSV